MAGLRGTALDRDWLDCLDGVDDRGARQAILPCCLLPDPAGGWRGRAGGMAASVSDPHGDRRWRYHGRRRTGTAFLPVLPIERFVAYQDALGLQPSTGEKRALGSLPQYYADMFGWHALAKKVAQAYAA